MSNKRNINESYKQYRARLKKQKEELKEKLKGTMIWQSTFQGYAGMTFKYKEQGIYHPKRNPGV